MKQLGLLLIICVLTIMGLGDALYANELNFSFVSTLGVVNVRPDSATDDVFRRVKVKDSLLVGDRVRLEAYSGAILDLAQSGTLVLKPETVSVLTKRIQGEIKFNLLAGELWLALKDGKRLGVMEIEMSQSVVKLMNGNMTFAVSPDGLDNYIRVISGEAEVSVKGRVGVSVLRPGQSMVLKQKLADAMRNKPAKGIVDVFDIEDEIARWETDTSHIGSDLSIDDLTKKINSYCDSIDKNGKNILSQYERIIAGSGTLSDVGALKTKIAEFQSILAEASQYGRNGKLRMSNFEKNTAPDRKKSGTSEDEDSELLDSYKKTSLQSAMTRLDTILSYFKNKLGKASMNVQEKSEPEKNIQKPMEALQPLEEALDNAFAISINIRKEILKGIKGKGQRWFELARETLLATSEALVKVGAQIAEEQILYPRDKQLPELAKRCDKYLEEIKRIDKSLHVVGVDESTMSALSDLQDRVAAYTSIIVTAIEEYRTTAGNTVAAKQKKRREFLRILNNYSSVKREYKRAERQCNGILRNIRPTSYVTEEMERVARLWHEIEVDFMRLDEESGTLRQIVNE